MGHAPDWPDGRRVQSTWNLHPWQAEIEAWAKELKDAANAVFRQVLLDAPSLELLRFEPSAWFNHQALRWGAATGGPYLGHAGLDRLSQAEQKWADFAIVQAAIEPRPTVWLLDEPEAALHRSADEHIARGPVGSLLPADIIAVARSNVDHERSQVARTGSRALGCELKELRP